MNKKDLIKEINNKFETSLEFLKEKYQIFSIEQATDIFTELDTKSKKLNIRLANTEIELRAMEEIKDSIEELGVCKANVESIFEFYPDVVIEEFPLETFTVEHSSTNKDFIQGFIGSKISLLNDNIVDTKQSIEELEVKILPIKDLIEKFKA